MNIIGYHKHSIRIKETVDILLKSAELYGHTTDSREVSKEDRKSRVIDIPNADLYVFCGWYAVRNILRNIEIPGNNKLIISDSYIRPKNYKVTKKTKRLGDNVYLCISNMLSCVGSKYVQLPNDRWELIKKAHNMSSLPWKKNGDLILVTYGTDTVYLEHKRNIQMYAKCIQACISKGFKVVVCSHPHEVRRKEPYSDASKIKEFKNLGCTFDMGADKYLDKSKYIISYPGSMEFKSIISGIPVFSVLNCFASNLYEDYDMTDIDSFLDNTPYPDRSKWFNWIAYQQWTYKELKEGLAWKFMIEDKNMIFKKDINKNRGNV